MEETIKQALDRVITQQKCHLCDVMFQNPNVKIAHCKSTYHKTQVSIFRNQMKQSMAQLHVTQPQSTSDSGCYCKICNVTAASKGHIWDHIKGHKHRAKLINLGLPPFEVLRCIVCNKNFPSDTHAFQHYLSSSHERRTDEWLKEKEKKAKPMTIPTVVIQPEKSVTELVHCSLCATSFTSSHKEQHLSSFPHVGLVKQKMALARQGILEEFWCLNSKELICRICTVNLKNKIDVESHFQAYVHQYNYLEWRKGNSKQKNMFEASIRLFYCEVCNQELDGTSDSERHYTNALHIKNNELYCRICSVRNSSQASFIAHNSSAKHSKALNKIHNDISEPLKTDPPALHPKQTSTPTLKHVPPKKVEPPISSYILAPPPPSNHLKQTTIDWSSTKIPQPDTNADPNSKQLKEKVFKELEKLVQKLYYSKTVPYKVALEYLEKINKDVGELEKKYKGEGAAASKGEAALNGHVYSSSDIAQDAIICKHQVNQSEATKEQDEAIKAQAVAIKKQDEAIKELEVALIEQDVATEVTLHKTELHDNDILQISGSGESIETADSFVTCSSNELLEFSNLLNQLAFTKQEVLAKDSDDSQVELKVLSEIEWLVATINGGELPLKETLECLKKYNEELRRIEVDDDPGEETIGDKVDNGPIEEVADNPMEEKPEDDIVKGKKEDDPMKREKKLEDDVVKRGKKDDPIKGEKTDDNQMEEVNIVDNQMDEEENVIDNAIQEEEVEDDDSIQDEEEQVTESIERNAVIANEKPLTYTLDQLYQLRPKGTLNNLNPQVIHNLSARRILVNLMAEADAQLGLYNYFPGDNFNPFMNFVDSYLQCNMIQNKSESEKRMTYTAKELYELRSEGNLNNLDPQVKSVLNERRIWVDWELIVEAKAQRSFYGYFTGDNFGRFMEFLDCYLQDCVPDVKIEEVNKKEDESREDEFD